MDEEEKEKVAKKEAGLKTREWVVNPALVCQHKVLERTLKDPHQSVDDSAAKKKRGREAEDPRVQNETPLQKRFKINQVAPLSQLGTNLDLDKKQQPSVVQY